jgi:ribonuclease Z
MALEVLFVGVASASPNAGEDTACYLVNEKILIDTGWNAALSMRAWGVDPIDISHLFFTHCHQDHTLGLPGLFFAGRLNRRSKGPAIKLYGPRDLPAVCDGACALLQGERYPDCIPDYEVEIVHPGEVVEVEGLEVSVGRSFHPLDARCYRFTDTSTGASAVFSGDTAFHEGLPLFASRCDLLIHEAAVKPDTEIMDLQRYLHSRPQDAARVAQEAEASELVLVHMAGKNGDDALARARETFPNTRLGKQGQKVRILSPGQIEWDF